MPIRPVSFLAQAAAQRQQTRENESQRKWQQEQALRDFGMNIGQSIIASLGNFGAQAGADAIRFNREEPYKKLESGVNPVAGAELDAGARAASSTPDMLAKAAMARVATPAQPAPSFTPAPVAAPAPQPVAEKALGFARETQDRMPVAKQAMAMAQESRQPSPAAPTPTPRPGRVMAPAKNYPNSVKAAVEAPPAPAPAPAPRVSEVATSTSSRGPANPEVTLQAQQQIMDIAKRWTSGEPLKFRKRDGTQLTPEEQSFAEAYQMKRDLGAIDMLHKQGLIEAEQANAISTRIKMQAEADAATTKAGGYVTEKNSVATKNYADASKSLSPVINKYGTVDPPGSLVIEKSLGGAPDAYIGPDGQVQRRGGGMGGGAPTDPGQIGGMVQLTPFDVNNRDAGIRPPPTPIPSTPEGLKAAASAATKTIGGAVGRWGQTAEEAKEALDYAAQAEKQPDPGIKQQLVNEGFAVLKRAQARELGEYAGTAEVVSTSPADVEAGEAAKEKARLTEEDRVRRLATGQKAQMDAALKDADEAVTLLRKSASPSTLFPGVKDALAKRNAAALLAGQPKVGNITMGEWEAAKQKLETIAPALQTRIEDAKRKYLEAGGQEDAWRARQLPPGPSQESPGQFPPPGQDSPGDESAIDDLFKRIESQPWSADRKRRVFLTRAREAGLA